ncbi:unnamed protein product, partial [Cladocopium goreaui]
GVQPWGMLLHSMRMGRRYTEQCYPDCHPKQLWMMISSQGVISDNGGMCGCGLHLKHLPFQRSLGRTSFVWLWGKSWPRKKLDYMSRRKSAMNGSVSRSSIDQAETLPLELDMDVGDEVPHFDETDLKQHGDTSVAADGHLHEASESEITTDDEDFG